MGSKIRCFFLLVVSVFVAGIGMVVGQQKQLVQVSGVIRSTTTDGVVPYVTIRNVSFNDQAFASNHQGYFSFVAHVGDTIRFTSLGYSPVELVIPKQVEDSKYTAMVRMTTDVVELEAAWPYPWASIDEFNMAFLALELADDDIIAAKKNLSAGALAAVAAVTPRDAREMQGYHATQTHFDLSNKVTNQRMANPLLSPFAWGNFIRQITEGNKSRSRNNW